MHVVDTLLNTIARALLLPVVLLLLLGLLVSCAVAWRTFHLALLRPRLRRAFERIHVQEGAATESVADLGVRPAMESAARAILGGESVRRESSIAEFECRCAKEAEPAKMLARLGPMLGLMATLIHIGPVLTAMASGDIAKMAADLEVAFAATVVGMVLGGCGFFAGLLLQRWQAEEMTVLEALERGRKRSDVAR